MRAAVVRSFGAADNILLEANFPKPVKIADSEVLVRVKYAGVNPVDTYMRSGQYPKLPQLPYAVGRDGSGVVEEIGSSVQHLSVGDRVWFSSLTNGATAEFCATSHACKLPEGVSFEQGACIGIPYMTAYVALFNSGGADPKSEKQQKILVHGASGAVGLAAVQLAKASGGQFTVVGTAGSAEGIELVENSGADGCVNHKSAEYVQELVEKYGAFDIVLEMNAHLNLTKSISLLAPKGRVVVIGSRGSISIDPRSLMQKDATVTGMSLANSISLFPSMAPTISRLLDTSGFRPQIREVFPIDQANKAQEAVVMGGASSGQYVISID